MQVQKQSITVGSRSVGSVWADGGAVRAEGGPLRPQLVIPLTIAMNTRPTEETLALVWLRASLSASQNVFPHLLVCQPTTELLVEGVPARSFPQGSPEHVVRLRFTFNGAEVEALESLRHANPGDVFTLYLGLEAVVAGVATHNDGVPGQPREASPWDIRHGLFSQMFPFWNTRIDTAGVPIERSTWVREVLPGLGHDRRRLLEVGFPPALPDHASAASEWDKARRAFDEQRYGDCVSECRDVLTMWQQQLGATKGRPVATVVAERSGWETTDSRVAFLDSTWKAAIDHVNVPHHPEGRASEQRFEAADARLMLMLTAALSEFVAGTGA